MVEAYFEVLFRRSSAENHDDVKLGYSVTLMRFKSEASRMSSITPTDLLGDILFGYAL